MHVRPQLASKCKCVCEHVYLCVCATAWSQRQIERCTVWAQMLTESHAHSHTQKRDTQPHGQTLVQALPAALFPVLYPVPGYCSCLPGLVTYKSDLHNSNNAHFGAKRMANYLLKSPTYVHILYTYRHTYTHMHINV